MNLYDKLITQGLLSDRWFDYPQSVYNNPTVRDYMNTDSRFVLVAAGRRAYKTEIAKRKLVLDAMSHNGRRYIIGASTFTQTKLIYWQSLQELLPSWIVKKIKESELTIELTNGSMIQLFSADSVERIEGGNPVSGCILDEISEYDIKSVWGRNIRPLLSDANGWAILIGVPRQTTGIQFKEMFKQYQKYAEWKVFTWSSIGILPQSEIDEIKASTDPITFAIEYGGSFTDNSGGLAYYRFNPEIHVRPIEFNTTLPVMVALDFNASIMSPQICQILNDGHLAVHKELTDRNTNVYKIAPIIQKELSNLYGSEQLAKTRRIWLYGDASGFSETANARGSAWHELKECFAGWNMDLRVKGKNPYIDARVSAFNARLQSADEKVHMSIHPDSHELIKDLELVSMDDLTKDKTKVGERTHASDALGYLVDYEWGMRRNAMFNL